jgi:uncharacterized protein YbjT (DUF2867 family)
MVSANSLDNGVVLVTGATGYVGGRLRRRLEEGGFRVRCLTRRPEALLGRVGAGTEVVRGDVLDPDSLAGAFEGTHTAYYLVHSMGASRDFEEEDRRAAHNFVAAADRAGVRRIIYLGGLGDPDARLSKHLRSRQETGEILRTSRAQVIEFRASIVLGSGSLSFELIRTLVERLPIMLCPRWVSVEAQPIAIEDVLSYLQGALDLPPNGQDRVFEIGGPDRLSYRDIMRSYAEERGLKRWMIPVPLLSPRLSSLWLGLVTPIYARVGRSLVESLRHPTVVRDPAARETFPVRPMEPAAAIRRALENEDLEFAETRWSDAFSAGSRPQEWGGVRLGPRLVDSRVRRVPQPPEIAFAPIRRIGGETGWYHATRLWRIRGFLDLLVGGVGLRRGRPHPEELRAGDPLDFWRVTEYEPPERLGLRAEMRVPGRAWLEFEVRPDGEGGSSIRQTASFDPLGLFGLAYWYALFPVHGYVFGGMLDAIARAAGEEAAGKAAAGDEAGG